MDTVEIKEGSAEKNAVDRLTDGGKLIEAVVATHAFHTMFFAPFNKLYPGLEYYGTPRHLRKITEITWSGNLIDDAIRSKWESEGVLMRVPEGSEFENPAEDNHFVGVFLLHQGSKTLFVDDTLMYYTNLGCILRCFVRNNTLKFHPSLYSNGLHPTSEAPLHFLEWIRKLNEDWEFDNICTGTCTNLDESTSIMMSDVFVSILSLIIRCYLSLQRMLVTSSGLAISS